MVDMMSWSSTAPPILDELCACAVPNIKTAVIIANRFMFCYFFGLRFCFAARVPPRSVPRVGASGLYLPRELPPPPPLDPREKLPPPELLEKPPLLRE